jgi:hypothetical protein
MELIMASFLQDRRQWNAKELMDSVSPRFSSPNKKLMFDLAFNSPSSPPGAIGYTRWRHRPLPERFDAVQPRVNVVEQAGFFDYLHDRKGNTVHWHLNFANNDVFGAWATSLLAQDELQVVEHPTLIALRLSAKRAGISMYCLEDGNPTPILITNIERRLQLATAPNAAVGRPNGLYGFRFAKATHEQLVGATTVFEKPQLSNILAIEAPLCATGTYTVSQIKDILITAFSGFAAARDESRLSMASEDVAIHSGYWGCGAYGGNRVAMALLQMIAAQLAGIQQLVLHVGDPSGHAPFEEATEIFKSISIHPNLPTSQLIGEIVAMKFQWGASDGN